MLTISELAFLWDRRFKALASSLLDKGDGETTCLKCGDYMDGQMGGICVTCWEKFDEHQATNQRQPNGAIPEVFKRPGMEDARMNLLEWQQNGFEARLATLEQRLGGAA